MSAQASPNLSATHPPSPVAGRRRARLVASGTKATAEQRLSRLDVQALQIDPSPASRAALATKFGRQYDELIEGRSRALAEAVLRLLVGDVEPKVRRALAEAVAASRNLPDDILLRLARDEPDVAGPILKFSPVLGDDDLAAIVRSHAMPYALAVAGRSHLSERLAEVLADTQEAEVVAVLVSNASARLSTATLQRIYKDFHDDRTIQDLLLRRSDLPYEIVDQLLAAIGARLDWSLLRGRRLSKAEARQLMAAVRDHATVSADGGNHGDRSVERQLRLASGELAPENILGFLRDGEIGRVEVGLALLAGVDLARASQLLHATDKRGLAALCARANFGAPHYVALRMALDLAEQGFEGTDPETIYSPDAIILAQKQYDMIRSDRSQIAFWFTA